MGDIFPQLVGKNLAHADGRKCSSEWSTNTTKHSGWTYYKGRGGCYGLYVAFSNRGLLADGLRHRYWQR